MKILNLLEESPIESGLLVLAGVLIHRNYGNGTKESDKRENLSKAKILEMQEQYIEAANQIVALRDEQKQIARKK